MARFSLSFLAIFVIFAALVLSLPTKTDDLSPNGQLGLDNALGDITAATKMINGFENKDTNNQKNEVEHAPSSSEDSEDNNDGKEEKKIKDGKVEATKTTKKPTSGNFVTATPTNHNKPTSQPNMLGKLPIVGKLLGGTGGF